MPTLQGHHTHTGSNLPPYGTTGSVSVAIHIWDAGRLDRDGSRALTAHSDHTCTTAGRYIPPVTQE